MRISLNNKEVDICIATFKRPELLSRLLTSIINQQCLPDKHNMQIIVIDNDVKETARRVVESFSLISIYPVIYEIEPVQNIALTRNRALKHVKGEYVLFVDDDEYVSEYWLASHINCAVKFNAEVVFGPVIPMLPDSAELWILKGGYFERKRFETGTERDRGGTGNTLVKTEIMDGDEPFDYRFGLTGGSDTKLFYSLFKKGHRLIWCDEAEVYENVTKDRMTIKWLALRAFRGGQVFIRVFFSNMPLMKKIIWLLLRFIFLVIYLISTPFSWLWGKHVGVKFLQKVCTYFGQITALSGIRQYEEYRYGCETEPK